MQLGPGLHIILYLNDSYFVSIGDVVIYYNIEQNMY